MAAIVLNAEKFWLIRSRCLLRRIPMMIEMMHFAMLVATKEIWRVFTQAWRPLQEDLQAVQLPVLLWDKNAITVARSSYPKQLSRKTRIILLKIEFVKTVGL